MPKILYERKECAYRATTKIQNDRFILWGNLLKTIFGECWPN